MPIFVKKHRVLNVGGDRAGHVHLLGYDFLDWFIGRLHTNFQISATLSKSSDFCPQMLFFNFLLR